MQLDQLSVKISNGILSAPQFDPDHWDDWLASRIEDQTPAKAEVLAYFCDAVFKQAKQKERIEMVVTEARKSIASGRQVILVGHSNGAAIDCGVLQHPAKLTIQQVHLFSGACEEDCTKNGINAAIRSGRLKQAFCYCSKKDDVLSKYDSWLLNHVYRALGYGFMGYAGTRNGVVGVNAIWRDVAHCGDDAFWGKNNREATWKLFWANVCGAA